MTVNYPSKGETLPSKMTYTAVATITTKVLRVGARPDIWVSSDERPDRTHP